jgi:hypothetical protein
MSSLPGYFVGGLAALLALDYVAPPVGTGLNFVQQGAATLAAPAINTVNRTHKGDRLSVASAKDDQENNVIATVEVVGLRDAAVVYRARDGQVLFSTDPLANATVVAKNVVLPEVTIRDTRRSNVQTIPAGPQPAPAASNKTISGDQKAREPKILEGCDPAFSPLAASARANFSTRCLASSTPTTQIAALP